MSTDYDDHVAESSYDLADICDRIERVEAAVKAGHWGTAWIAWGVLLFIAFYSWIPGIWYSRTRYSFWYGLSASQVILAHKPADCDFLRSPLGYKGCHYDREISRVIVDVNQWGGQSISYDGGHTWTQTAKNDYGAPIVSHDDGKTWSTEMVPGRVEPHVNISWTRVDEDRN